MKSLLHLVPAADPAASFDDDLRAIATEFSLHPDSAGAQVTPMIRLEGDPFGADTPWRGTIEVDGSLDAETLISLHANFSRWIAEVSDVGRSSFLIGEDVVFIASERAPIRYQYAMRRNDRFDHDAYLERYREVHSRFGLETPGILGYTQFHVDLVASERGAKEIGVGVWDVDSVSELHLASLEAFLSEIAKSRIGAEAIADEEIFVARDRSHDFCSRVEWA